MNITNEYFSNQTTVSISLISNFTFTTFHTGFLIESHRKTPSCISSKIQNKITINKSLSTRLNPNTCFEQKHENKEKQII